MKTANKVSRRDANQEAPFFCFVFFGEAKKMKKLAEEYAPFLVQILHGNDINPLDPG